MRQKPTECIAHARSYTALFRLASATWEKDSREANNSRATSDANIDKEAIISCDARKGRLAQSGLRALRTSSVLERIQETLAIHLLG